MRLTPKNTLAIAVGAIFMVSPAFGIDLAKYLWENRLLLVFSPTETESGFAAFDRDLKSEHPEVMDRDLIVFRVFETGASRLEAESLASEEADQLRRRFGVTSGQFAVILIGKDGGVKLLQKRQADLQEIFNRIDSMPMRQQEMREKRQNK